MQCFMVSHVSFTRVVKFCRVVKYNGSKGELDKLEADQLSLMILGVVASMCYCTFMAANGKLVNASTLR